MPVAIPTGAISPARPRIGEWPDLAQVFRIGPEGECALRVELTPSPGNRRMSALGAEWSSIPDGRAPSRAIQARSERLQRRQRRLPARATNLEADTG